MLLTTTVLKTAGVYSSSEDLSAFTHGLLWPVEKEDSSKINLVCPSTWRLSRVRVNTVELLENCCCGNKDSRPSEKDALHCKESKRKGLYINKSSGINYMHITCIIFFYYYKYSRLLLLEIASIQPDKTIISY